MDILKTDTLDHAPVENTELNWFAAHFEMLQKQYPGQWIAIYEDRVIAHGETLTGVIHASHQQGVPDAYCEWIPLSTDASPIHIL